MSASVSSVCYSCASHPPALCQSSYRVQTNEWRLFRMANSIIHSLSFCSFSALAVFFFFFFFAKEKITGGDFFQLILANKVTTTFFGRLSLCLSHSHPHNRRPMPFPSALCRNAANKYLKVRISHGFIVVVCMTLLTERNKNQIVFKKTATQSHYSAPYPQYFSFLAAPKQHQKICRKRRTRD